MSFLISLPFLTGIAFHHVKKSPLITGIVDRIKINSEQLFPFSESELSHTFCKLLFRDDSSDMDKSSSAKCLLHSDVVKGEPSPTGRGRRRSPDEKGNQGVGDFRFTNILQLFSIYFSFFFNIFTLSLFFYTFFSHDIYPHPHDPRHLATLLLCFWRLFFYPRQLPKPTPTTHDLYTRPTTFSYTL